MRKLALLPLLLSSTALAQAPSPAQMGITQGTPQTLNVLDSTKTWVPAGAYTNGLDPRAFGAKCDGVADDTTALRAWAASATDGARLVVPGACVFTDRISFPPVLSGVTIEGSGHPSRLIYSGASTTLDPIIQIGQRDGPGGCAARGWTLRGLQFLSTTVMTAGDALRISDGCNWYISDLSMGANLDSPTGVNRNFYNALHLDGGAGAYLNQFGLVGSGSVLTINGEAGVGTYHQFTDPFLNQGHVVYGRIGIHLCGGVGGFHSTQLDVLQNGTNVLIDRACVNHANLQITFGPETAIDATNASLYPAEPQIGVHVSDPGGPQTIINYLGWLATATNQCFVYDAGTPDDIANPPIVNFVGARIGNCHAPTVSNGGAIDNQSAYAKINVTATRFFTSQGGRQTIRNAAGGPSVTLQAVTVDPNFSVGGVWDGAFQNNGSFTVQGPSAFTGALTVTGLLTATNITSVGNVAGLATQSTGPGGSIQSKASGTQPADAKNWFLDQNSTNGDFRFRAISDDLANSATYMTFTRASAAPPSLTGAKTTIATPITASALPTSAGAGGLFVCVDSAGVLYKKATCP